MNSKNKGNDLNRYFKPINQTQEAEEPVDRENEDDSFDYYSAYNNSS